MIFFASDGMEAEIKEAWETVKAAGGEIQALRYSVKVWTPDDARAHCKKRGGSFEAASNKKEKGELTMDPVTKESFATAYPELDKAIRQEAFEKGFSEGMTKGKADGAEAERNRIRGVEDQLIPGHEVLISELKYDGKTTGPEAAVIVLKKEKDLLKTKRENMVEDGKKAIVKDANPPVTEQLNQIEPEAQMEKLVKEKIAQDPKLPYSKALITVQKENPDLARKILDKLNDQRGKKKE